MHKVSKSDVPHIPNLYNGTRQLSTIATSTVYKLTNLETRSVFSKLMDLNGILDKFIDYSCI